MPESMERYNPYTATTKNFNFLGMVLDDYRVAKILG